MKLEVTNTKVITMESTDGRWFLKSEGGNTTICFRGSGGSDYTFIGYPSTGNLKNLLEMLPDFIAELEKYEDELTA